MTMKEVQTTVPPSPDAAAPKASAARSGSKRLAETTMHIIFLVCGLIAVGFVLVISIYLIISGLPAIREIGLVDFLFGKTRPIPSSASCP